MELDPKTGMPPLAPYWHWETVFKPAMPQMRQYYTSRIYLADYHGVEIRLFQHDKLIASNRVWFYRALEPENPLGVAPTSWVGADGKMVNSFRYVQTQALPESEWVPFIQASAEALLAEIDRKKAEEAAPLDRETVEVNRLREKYSGTFPPAILES